MIEPWILGECFRRRLLVSLDRFHVPRGISPSSESFLPHSQRRSCALLNRDEKTEFVARGKINPAIPVLHLDVPEAALRPRARPEPARSPDGGTGDFRAFEIVTLFDEAPHSEDGEGALKISFMHI